MIVCLCVHVRLMCPVCVHLCDYHTMAKAEHTLVGAAVYLLLRISAKKSCMFEKCEKSYQTTFMLHVHKERGTARRNRPPQQCLAGHSAALFQTVCAHTSLFDPLLAQKWSHVGLEEQQHVQIVYSCSVHLWH